MSSSYIKSIAHLSGLAVVFVTHCAAEGGSAHHPQQLVKLLQPKHVAGCEAGDASTQQRTESRASIVCVSALQVTTHANLHYHQLLRG